MGAEGRRVNYKMNHIQWQEHRFAGAGNTAAVKKTSQGCQVPHLYGQEMPLEGWLVGS